MAVDVELLRAGSAAESDAAPRTFEVCPSAAKSRQFVLQRGQLDLVARLGGPRVRAEDLQDQLTPVHHRDADLVLDVARLVGCQRVVADDAAAVRELDDLRELFELACSDIAVRVSDAAVLHHAARGDEVRRLRELLQLI